MLDECHVTLDEDDLVEVYRPAPRPRRLQALVLILAFMLALLIAILMIRYPGARLALIQSPLVAGLLGAVILAAALVGLLLLAAPTLRRRAARSTLDDHPGMRDPIHYTFDEDHFAVRSTFAQASYPWAQMWDWRESARVVIVMPSPRHFYVLPKRGIDPAVIERLRDHLASVRKRKAERGADVAPS